MTQKTLQDIEWDDENPIQTTTTEWKKLEIGDTLLGIFIDRYKDNTYNKMKYLFQPANIIRNQTGRRETYEKLGINSSGNLDYKLNDDQLLGQPLKIMRVKDKHLEGRPNPAHQFIVIPAKKQGGKK